MVATAAKRVGVILQESANSQDAGTSISNARLTRMNMSTATKPRWLPEMDRRCTVPVTIN